MQSPAIRYYLLYYSRPMTCTGCSRMFVVVGDECAAGARMPPLASACFSFSPSLSLLLSYPMLSALGGFSFNSSLPCLVLVFTFVHAHPPCLTNPSLKSPTVALAPSPSHRLPRIDVVLPWISSLPAIYINRSTLRATTQPQAYLQAAGSSSAGVAQLPLLGSWLPDHIAAIIWPLSSPSLLIIVSRDTPVPQSRKGEEEIAPGRCREIDCGYVIAFTGAAA
ncbi:uncharacterized protein TrAFT101_004979 [Trichoderma asperellum]|uniref:uncharacterized protein n=1 Tax=Trichoderma asperellum TaxID=101201 RepID=UPI0033184D5F|nr:hypothetical protein TrAFT101_004979 [Trichoderma asperellum]